MTETTTIDTDQIYDKVDDFIKRLHEKDIALNPKAQTIIEEKTVGKDYWGRKIKKSFSLADLIVEEVSAYQEIESAKARVRAYYDAKKDESIDSFLLQLDMESALRRRKDDVACRLFENIEKAQVYGLIDEIGLGNKLKRLEEENLNQKKLISSLEKLNKDLKKENDRLHKLFPDNKRGKTEVGDLGKLDS
jgi:uncharacterized protein YlaN (UPF0358 family)